MKNLILLLLFVFLVSCGTKTEVNNTVSTLAPKTEAKTEYSNPSVMAGSNMGSFFLGMLRTQNYNDALKFVSKESLKEYGKEAILSNFKAYSYNYKLKLVSISGGVLKFTTNEFATGKFKTMRYVVENDTCKVVLSKKLEIFGIE